ncbi:SprT family zinc-dependent metalloprotease [Halobacterium salinarum]|uniref:M48 family metallopeptidase n=1 Tax=Halobacterium salinarum TaxID=2242 RepID=UPI002554E761|nr:SprT family zinc-dependent metalloprotease [Halobacterium salinarum]MDL0130062.1 SprT family zinc-dependent metalloprotease [Halobacterium salinarum]
MPVIRVFDETIQYDIVESEDATQPRIDVDIHGVNIILPTETDIDAETVADENAQWILEKWREYETHRDRAPERTFSEGETFHYLGEERTLTVEITDKGRVTPTEFVLPETKVEACGIEDVLEDLYRREARDYFQERIDHYADEMGVNPGQLELRNQRTRWASCSVQRTLSFNWRLVMAPPDVIDYVVVHELAHLRERNHTRRFWQIVQRYDPDYEQHVEWLKENGVRLIFTEDDL